MYLDASQRAVRILFSCKSHPEPLNERALERARDTVGQVPTKVGKGLPIPTLGKKRLSGIWLLFENSGLSFVIVPRLSEFGREF